MDREPRYPYAACVLFHCSIIPEANGPDRQRISIQDWNPD
ncbi:hypothetical protein B4098_1429 [Heyndrickxia coagulans]|uniref:Uncharacterized protein n=1 Tax=Heyndrickxia coagulans TaxID=1398 RepID=A0A150KAA4_HEYCO|nr:hypothetical protein B4098_1429 [Heyndrickxia coagulans]